MSVEKEDPLSMYDNPLGEVPEVPIGQIGHTDGNGHRKSHDELLEIKDVALKVGADVTDRPHGEHNSTVVRHRAWIRVGGALGTAMGLTAAGLATAFVIEHHRRKKEEKTEQLLSDK